MFQRVKSPRIGVLVLFFASALIASGPEPARQIERVLETRFNAGEFESFALVVRSRQVVVKNGFRFATGFAQLKAAASGPVGYGIQC